MLKYTFVLSFILLSILSYAQPIIMPTPPATISSYTPTITTVDYTSNTYVYRASTEIVFTAGFEMKQTGNTTQKYFLGYINKPAAVLYAELKEEQDDSYILALNSTLNFKYDEKYSVNANAPLSFVIYDYKMNQMACSSLTKNYGPNYFSLDLIGYDFLLNQYYTLVVTGEKGEKKYLRFKYMIR